MTLTTYPLPDPEANQTRAVPRAPKPLADGSFGFVASTEDLDSYGTILRVKGWELARFRANPAIMWAHRYDVPPVGRATRIAKARSEAGPTLEVDVQFARAEDHGGTWPEGYPSPAQVEAMVRSGYIRGTSVGFKPLEWDWMRRDGKPDGEVVGVEYLRQELLEVSIAPIPSNPGALARCLSEGLLVRSHLPGLLRVATSESPVEVLAAIAEEIVSGTGLTRRDRRAILDVSRLLEEIRRVGDLAREIAEPHGSPLGTSGLDELREALSNLSAARCRALPRQE